VELYKRITRAGVVKKWLINNNLIVEDKMEGAQALIWEALKKSILEIAIKHISKKKICKTRAAKDSKKRPRLDKLIVELDRWREHQEKVPDRDRKYKWEMERQGHRELKIEKEKIKQIKRCIERRYQMIDGEQGKIIVSLLEKPFNHAVIDRLLENQNNTKVLICDSEK
ncbi:10948_t:CDS:2, partial [Gigaspora margarita]